MKEADMRNQRFIHLISKTKMNHQDCKEDKIRSCDVDLSEIFFWVIEIK